MSSKIKTFMENSEIKGSENNLNGIKLRAMKRS